MNLATRPKRLRHLVVMAAAWLLFLVPGLVSAADRESRVGLVVGVSEYNGQPLPNALADARGVKETLEKIGFTIVLLENPSSSEFRQAVESISRQVGSRPKNTTVLFYFAGHAVQMAGENYLIPRNLDAIAQAGPSAKADARWLSAQRILEELSATRAPRLIFVLDACRTDPRRHEASGARGLAGMQEITPGPETLILFSAQPGRPAYDGKSGTRGLFSQALSDALLVPNMSMPEVVAGVSERVSSATSGKQRPYNQGSLVYTLNRVETVGQKLSEQYIEASRINGPEDGAALLREALRTRSLAQLEADAEAGDGFAHYLVGTAYWDGSGGAAKDSRKAIRHMRAATARGIGRAASTLGYYYCCSDELGRNEGEALEWFRVGADLGSVQAMRNLGISLSQGKGVPRDVEGGEVYLQKAADAGSAIAWFNLASLYDEPQYGKVDTAKAMVYYRQSLNGGYGFAASSIGQIYQNGSRDGSIKPDLNLAVASYIEGGELGCGACWFSAGVIFNSDEYAGRNPQAAFALFKRGADEGNVDSVLEYGRLLARGEGGQAADPKAAFDFYRSVQHLGHPEIDGKIALALAKGDGPAPSPEEAAQLLRGILEREKSTDPAVRYLVYEPNYWAYGDALIGLLESGQARESYTGELPTLVKRYGPKDGRMKRFTVPVTCGSLKTPFQVYVKDWDRPDDETIEGQVNWLKEMRGCDFPKDVLESFKKLKAIARDNNVSFSDLAVYALGKQPADPFYEGSSTREQANAIFVATTSAKFVRNPELDTDTWGVALHGFDAVSYVSEKAASPGSAEYFALWNGGIWLFTSEANRSEFLKTPERYGPLFGGFCANCLSSGGLKSGDPRIFVATEAGLVLFSDAAARTAWLADAKASHDAAMTAWIALAGAPRTPHPQTALGALLADLHFPVKKGAGGKLDYSSPSPAEKPQGSGEPVSIDPALLDEKVVVLLQGKNDAGEPMYSYLQLTLAKLQKLRDKMRDGSDFEPSDYGTVLAEGKGVPDDAVKARMAKEYNMIDVQRPPEPPK